MTLPNHLIPVLQFAQRRDTSLAALFLSHSVFLRISWASSLTFENRSGTTTV